VTDREATLRFRDLMEADEIFATGNYAKVTPLSQIEGRKMQPGSVYSRARNLYFECAKSAAGPENARAA